MKFDINKFGIAWTSAFISYNLVCMIEYETTVVYLVCMISQIALLFLFLATCKSKTTGSVNERMEERIGGT